MDKLRRTMMYVPGNNPGMIGDAGIYGADSIMFDLEDSVALTEKDSARLLVYCALKTIDFNGTEIVVRINGLDSAHGEKDIEAMVKAGVDVIRLPKTECAEDIQAVEDLVKKNEMKCGIPVGKVKLMAAVESPLGVINAYSIAKASSRMIGIAIGAEDYVTSMRTTRSTGGVELLSARGQLVMAARAAGIVALDTVYSNLEDMQGFEEEVKLIKQLGFDGKSVINPRQIEVVNRIYKPTEEEVFEAKAVMRAIQEANERGLGVVSLDGKMIDKPIVERAERVLIMAGVKLEVSLNEELAG